MRYDRVISAEFLRRPNRFIAYCSLEGREETVHVKNTGRCRELLIPGAAVYLTAGANPARKTAWDLIAVEKLRGKPPGNPLLVNMDSQAPNQVLYEAMAGGFRLPGQPGPLTLLRREVAFGDSRFDLYAEAAQRDEAGAGAGLAAEESGDGGPEQEEPGRLWRAFIEVKGVTLEEKGICRFPDAPTERGTRHLRELVRAKAAGYAAYVVFIVQMGEMIYFTPHTERDPAFTRALREADAAGVTVLAYDCRVTPDSLALGRPVEIRLR
ncbi:MAG: DNA/RNA nuclease SfsA [Peptococcaceae bacterium]|nr:DNA/RNA nuclease SfsA [Peptococcaceae bacterium]